jgi:hypothetical protein
MLLLDSWLKQQVKVGGVYIAIRQHLVLCQCRKGTGDTGLSGATLTA